MTEFKILRNLDNGILDLKEPWEVHRKKITTPRQLESSMRNLKIGILIVDEPFLSNKLSFAGWKESIKGEWIRPRITELVSRF